MKKRFLFFIGCVFLIILTGWKIYQLRVHRAEQALTQFQTLLGNMAGQQGHVSYGRIFLPKLSQTLVLNDVSIGLSDGSLIQIRKLRVVPASRTKLVKVVAHSVSIQHGIRTMEVRNLYLYDVFLPLNPVKPSENPSDMLPVSSRFLSAFSFRQGSMEQVALNSLWGKDHVEIRNIQLGYNIREHKRVYTVQDIEYFPSIKEWHSKLNHRLLVHRLTIQTKEDQKPIAGDILASLLKKQDIFLHFQDLNAYHYSLDPYWTCKDMSITLNARGNSFQSGNMDGRMQGMGIAYDAVQGQHPINIYLGKIGYNFLKGTVSGDFSYNVAQHAVTWHPLVLDGENFVHLTGLLDFTINPQDDDFLRAIHLESLILFISDTGMQDHVLQAFARKTGLSHDQAKQEIIRRFAAYATGKDFNLDRQFYATLTDMMQNPDTQQMKVTADFSFKENQKTNMRDLFDMNFLDFFKIMNQGDLQIVTVKNNNKNQ